MKRLINKILMKWRYRKLLKKAKAINPNPRTYIMMEYNSWGYKIAFHYTNEDEGFFGIVGWLPRRPEDGDFLVYKVGDGIYAKGLIFDTKYQNNPNDMFFAKVLPIEEVEI